MRLIEGKLRASLLELVLKRAPEEAVGLLLHDDRIIELPNRSEHAEDSFMASRNDIIEAIRDIDGLDLENVVLWHSHPNGGVGPSRVDMRNKTPFRYHLVVSLIDDDIVPTWY